MSGGGYARDMADGRDWARIMAAEAADQTWRERAACRSVGPDLFFVDRGTNATGAKAMCGRCPVAAQCLDYALTANIRQGVWGGLSDQELRALRRSRRRSEA